MAFDYETAPDEEYRGQERAALDPARARIAGCSFSVKPGTGIYVPVAHRTGENIDRDGFMAFLKEFLTDTSLLRKKSRVPLRSIWA